MRRGRINAPFCYQTLGALEVLERYFKGQGQRLSTARSIYMALTQLANEPQDPRRRGFKAERKIVSERAGCSPSTVTNYIDDLEATGLVQVTRVEGEAYEWELLEPDETWTPRGLTTAKRGSANGSQGPSQPSGDPPASDQEGVSQPLGGSLIQEEERDTSSSPPPGGGDVPDPGDDDDPGVPLAVSNRRTSRAERVLAAEVLAAFNERFETDFRSEDHLKAIVGRLRERPDLDLNGHREVIARTHEAQWWSGPPSPRLIYGSGRAFDQAINRRETKAFAASRGGDLSAYDRGADPGDQGDGDERSDDERDG